jgi:putative tryptophan/tyrosine transport system substrate-binding protein
MRALVAYSSISSLGLCIRCRRTRYAPELALACPASMLVGRASAFGGTNFCPERFSASTRPRCRWYQRAVCGYVLDRNVAFERRGAQFQLDRLPELVDELVARRVDVIVAIGYPAAAAAKQGTKTIPIVSAGTPDAIATGLVNSLSRPGGNLTGISDDAVALSAKRLQLLKEAVPQLRHVAMLYNAADLGMTQRYQVAAAAAQTLGLAVQPLPVHEPEGFDEAFAAMTREPPDGLLMVTDALTALNHRRVFEFTAAHRLPAIYEFEAFVRDGGLMSYGSDMRELQDRVAGLIDRILKGTKPAELPFEQPTRFPFVINLKTAKALGLAIPPFILARADKVIE